MFAWLFGGNRPTGLLQSISSWLNSPRPNYSPVASVLPVRIRSDESVRYHFDPPKAGVPRSIRLVERGGLLGTTQLPPAGGPGPGGYVGNGTFSF